MFLWRLIVDDPLLVTEPFEGKMSWQKALKVHLLLAYMAGFPCIDHSNKGNRSLPQRNIYVYTPWIATPQFRQFDWLHFDRIADILCPITHEQWPIRWSRAVEVEWARWAGSVSDLTSPGLITCLPPVPGSWSCMSGRLGPRINKRPQLYFYRCGTQPAVILMTVLLIYSRQRARGHETWPAVRSEPISITQTKKKKIPFSSYSRWM